MEAFVFFYLLLFSGYYIAFAFYFVNIIVLYSSYVGMVMFVLCDGLSKVSVFFGHFSWFFGEGFPNVTDVLFKHYGGFIIGA